MISKRRDDKGRALQQGEWQEPSGRYRYKYTDSLGKRKILYSWRLTESDKMPEGKREDSSLREKERKVQSLQMQGITGSKLTVLELVERYLSLKTGVKHNTLANYNFVVNVLKKEEFSHKKVDDVKLSDALEMGMEPQEESQYWVCSIIVEYMNDRLDKELLQYIQDNEGNGMQFLNEYYEK